jgi:hypothetical protein
MRAIKNFIHGTNDIVLAIVIVAIATGLILWRMKIILEYPEVAANNISHTEQTEQQVEEEGN